MIIPEEIPRVYQYSYDIVGAQGLEVNCTRNAIPVITPPLLESKAVTKIVMSLSCLPL